MELITLVKIKILGEKFCIVIHKINLTIAPETMANENNNLLLVKSNILIKSEKSL